MRSMRKNQFLKTAYFYGKTQEFVGEWMERNNVSKLKSVFEGML